MSITINGSTGISGVDGSAGTPALKGGDTDTGISFGTDVIIASTGGTERARIDASGNLLVGASSYRSVGDPFSPTSVIFNEGSGVVDYQILAGVHNRASIEGPSIVLGKSRGATNGSVTIVQNGDHLGEIAFAGADGVDLATRAALIRAEVDGTPGADDMPGRLVFGTTADGAALPTERARIDSGGRLLVGTTTARSKFFGADIYSPFVQFESANTENPGRFVSIVYGDNSAIGPVLTLAKHRSDSLDAYTVAENNDEAGQISFQAADGTRFVECAEIRAEVDGTPGNLDMPGRLLFSTTADGTSNPTARMLISGTGEVRFQNHIAGGGNVGSTFRSAGASVDQLRMISENTGFATLQVFANNNGDIGGITTSGFTTAYNTSSDYRLKENVTSVPDGITRLQQLKPSRFNFITDPDKTVDGFLAHEAQAVVPECATGTKDAVDEDGNPVYQGIDQSKLVPLLTAALQEAITRIEQLETRIATLEAQP